MAQLTHGFYPTERRQRAQLSQPQASEPQGCRFECFNLLRLSQFVTHNRQIIYLAPNSKCAMDYFWTSYSTGLCVFLCIINMI